jgi:hypothetical protein
MVREAQDSVSSIHGRLPTMLSSLAAQRSPRLFSIERVMPLRRRMCSGAPWDKEGISQITLPVFCGTMVGSALPMTWGLMASCTAACTLAPTLNIASQVIWGVGHTMLNVRRIAQEDAQRIMQGLKPKGLPNVDGGHVTIKISSRLGFRLDVIVSALFALVTVGVRHRRHRDLVDRSATK